MIFKKIDWNISSIKPLTEPKIEITLSKGDSDDILWGGATGAVESDVGHISEEWGDTGGPMRRRRRGWHLGCAPNRQQK